MVVEVDVLHLAGRRRHRNPLNFIKACYDRRAPRVLRARYSVVELPSKVKKLTLSYCAFKVKNASGGVSMSKEVGVVVLNVHVVRDVDDGEL
jgi:hypothetical protein